MSNAANTPPCTPDDSFKYWAYRYEAGHHAWNNANVYPVLEKHLDKLTKSGQTKKVLVTMCGMSEDMNWLVDKGLEVIGVDIALPALTKFISRSDQEWTEKTEPKLGPGAKVFTRKDGKIKLYWGDALAFPLDVEGTFDAIYDCNGLHVLNNAKTRLYASMIKKLLNPGGRLLLEAGAYDEKLLEDENFKPPLPVPPPYSLRPQDIKDMFEPECTVQHIDTTRTNKIFYNQECHFHDYLIVKK